MSGNVIVTSASAHVLHYRFSPAAVKVAFSLDKYSIGKWSLCGCLVVGDPRWWSHDM
jgi:hypothetical protein